MHRRYPTSSFVNSNKKLKFFQHFQLSFLNQVYFNKRSSQGYYCQDSHTICLRVSNLSIRLHEQRKGKKVK